MLDRLTRLFFPIAKYDSLLRVQARTEQLMWIDKDASDRLAVPPAEAARLASLSRTKLYEILGTGELKSFKVGARRLIRIAELERWLAANEPA
jgi:excisionase family DNA binding protein